MTQRKITLTRFCGGGGGPTSGARPTSPDARARAARPPRTRATQPPRARDTTPARARAPRARPLAPPCAVSVCASCACERAPLGRPPIRVVRAHALPIRAHVRESRRRAPPTRADGATASEVLRHSRFRGFHASVPGGFGLGSRGGGAGLVSEEPPGAQQSWLTRSPPPRPGLLLSLPPRESGALPPQKSGALPHRRTDNGSHADPSTQGAQRRATEGAGLPPRLLHRRRRPHAAVERGWGGLRGVRLRAKSREEHIA